MNPTDQSASISRRQALKSMGCGFGLLSAAALANNQAAASVNPLSARPPHFKPRAKRIIFLFMQGGPSQVDTFDYKPLLEQRNGEAHTFDDARVLAKTKKITKHKVFESPWKIQTLRILWTVRLGVVPQRRPARR